MTKEYELMQSINAEATNLCGVILKAMGEQKPLVAMNALKMAMDVVYSTHLNASRKELERECCSTFHRTPHRSTCEKFRGKKPANA